MLSKQDFVACNALDEQAVAREMHLLAAHSPGGGPLMSEAEVAEFIRCDPKTLQNIRHECAEAVPLHTQMPGNRGVVYARHDVLRFVAQRLLLAKARRIHRL